MQKEVSEDSSSSKECEGKVEDQEIQREEKVEDESALSGDTSTVSSMRMARWPDLKKYPSTVWLQRSFINGCFDLYSWLKCSTRKILGSALHAKI